MGELFQNGWCICFFQVAQTNINFLSFSFGDPKPQIHGEDNSGILFSSGEAPNPDPRQKQTFPVQLFCFIFKFSVNMKTFEKLSFFSPALSRYNGQKLFIFKVYNVRFYIHIYCEMITTIKSINMPTYPSPHIVTILCVCGKST